MELAETQKAWLAAAIDGEGSITFVTRKMTYRKKDGTCSNYVYHMPYVEICNTVLDFVQHAKNISNIGYIKISKSKNARVKTMFRWIVYNYGDISRLLPVIMPYLIIKREKAKRILTYINFRLTRGKTTKRGHLEQSLFSGTKTEIDEIAQLL